MAEFVYNNSKNASTGHMFFTLNCKYYPRVFYKEGLNLCSQLKTAEKLFSKLQSLIAAY